MSCPVRNNPDGQSAIGQMGEGGAFPFPQMGEAMPVVDGRQRRGAFRAPR